MKKSQHTTKDELAKLGINLEHKPGMPYSVPDDYFEASKNEIVTNISSMSFIDNLPKKMPQEVPANYFADAQSDILENIGSISFLEGLPKEMPQTVPDDYFEQSKVAILTQLSTPEAQSPLTKGYSRKRQSWALAATMALLVSIGLFFMNPKTQTSSIEDSLSQIPTELIDQYIEDNEYDFDAFEILENPQGSTAKLESLEEQILNETKTMSNEEIFSYVL